MTSNIDFVISTNPSYRYSGVPTAAGVGSISGRLVYSRCTCQYIKNSLLGLLKKIPGSSYFFTPTPIPRRKKLIIDSSYCEDRANRFQIKREQSLSMGPLDKNGKPLIIPEESPRSYKIGHLAACGEDLSIKISRCTSLRVRKSECEILKARAAEIAINLDTLIISKAKERYGEKATRKCVI